MNKTIREFLNQGSSSSAAALAVFDQLDSINIDEINGVWHAKIFNTGHPLDIPLQIFGWYGKEFTDKNHVHPLLFAKPNSPVFFADPKRIPIRLFIRFPFLANKISAGLFHAFNFIFKTTLSKAVMRMAENRGKISATMIYDDIPAIDQFRKVDENMIFGMSEMKGLNQPQFFILFKE